MAWVVELWILGRVEFRSFAFWQWTTNELLLSQLLQLLSDSLSPGFELGLVTLPLRLLDVINPFLNILLLLLLFLLKLLRERILQGWVHPPGDTATMAKSLTLKQSLDITLL